MDYISTSALWCFTNAEGWERTAPHIQHTTLLVICKMKMKSCGSSMKMKMRTRMGMKKRRRRVIEMNVM